MFKTMARLLVLVALLVGVGATFDSSHALAAPKDKSDRADGVCGGLEPELCETIH